MLRTTLALATVALALFTGCTPDIDRVEAHPDFDYETLQQGGVAVLPARVSVPDLAPEDAQYLLVDNISDHRRDVPVRSANGDAGVDDIVAAYDRGGALPHDALQAVAASSGRRFIAVILIHSYTTHTTEVSDTYVDEDGFSYSELTVTAEADLDGEVALIDADSRQVWWRGDHVATDYHQRIYSDDDPLWGLLSPNYPDPPSPYAMTDELMDTMVKNWPDRD